MFQLENQGTISLFKSFFKIILNGLSSGTVKNAYLYLFCKRIEKLRCNDVIILLP